MTPEQRFKRRARKALRDRWKDLSKKQVDGIVNDAYDWYIENNHADMTEPVWYDILEKNNIYVNRGE